MNNTERIAEIRAACENKKYTIYCHNNLQPANEPIAYLLSEVERLTAELEQKTRELERLRDECIKINQFETTQSAKLLQRCGELEHKIGVNKEAEAALNNHPATGDALREKLERERESI